MKNQSKSKGIIVAVSGGSGSGKSTIVEKLKKYCTTIQIQHFFQDNYYKDQSHLCPEERKNINYDHPDVIDHELIYEHLKNLSQGKDIQCPKYDFSKHIRTTEVVTIPYSPIIIFDGIFSLYYPDLQEFYTLKIFVDVCDDIRFIRRLYRDQAERGRSQNDVIEQYLKFVKPMHDQYVYPSRRNADIVIPWNQGKESTIRGLGSLLLGIAH